MIESFMNYFILLFFLFCFFETAVVSQVFFESSTTKDKMGTGRERSFSTGARYKKGEESLRKVSVFVVLTF